MSDKFEPDASEPKAVARRDYKKNDLESLKLAEILYYEGRSAKEISYVTGIPVATIKWHAYSSKNRWEDIKAKIISLRRQKAITNIVESANNYSKILKEASERLAKDVIDKGMELDISEQKTISDIVLSQIKGAQLVQSEQSPDNQTNIQININKEEADKILADDPAQHIVKDVTNEEI